MSVLIVQNTISERPGLIQKVLQERGIPYQIANIELGDSFPELSEFKATIILGGPDSANDQTIKMIGEINKIREILSKNMPYLGICLGMQALVKAYDGKVFKSPVKETGFRGPDGEFFKINLTEMGKEDPFLDGVKPEVNIFQLHSETVEIHDKVSLLGEGQFCRNQIVKVGNNGYGVQGHFELTEPLFNIWLNEDPDLSALDRQRLISDFQLCKDNYEKTGRTIFNNFLKIAQYGD